MNTSPGSSMPTGAILVRIKFLHFSMIANTPVDKNKNADGQRRRRDAVAPPGQAGDKPAGVAPLLSELMREYAASGLPPAYLPQN